MPAWGLSGLRTKAFGLKKVDILVDNDSCLGSQFAGCKSGVKVRMEVFPLNSWDAATLLVL